MLRTCNLCFPLVKSFQISDTNQVQADDIYYIVLHYAVETSIFISSLNNLYGDIFSHFVATVFCRQREDSFIRRKTYQFRTTEWKL
jgi:hypothetical protein